MSPDQEIREIANSVPPDQVWIPEDLRPRLTDLLVRLGLTESHMCKSGARVIHLEKRRWRRTTGGEVVDRVYVTALLDQAPVTLKWETDLRGRGLFKKPVEVGRRVSLNFRPLVYPTNLRCGYIYLPHHEIYVRYSR